MNKDLEKILKNIAEKADEIEVEVLKKDDGWGFTPPWKEYPVKFRVEENG
jgi:hypothetical protein